MAWKQKLENLRYAFQKEHKRIHRYLKNNKYFPVLFGYLKREFPNKSSAFL